MEQNDDIGENRFSREIAEKEKRKIKVLRENKRSVWLGLGMFGMIGWAVAVPTLLGAALGLWLDKKYTQSFSWTLTLLILGLFLGCIIAWHWVAKENQAMHRDENENNE